MPHLKKIYILLDFLLITTALLIVVSIYCYLIKYKSKQKHLLPYFVTNDKSKKFDINLYIINKDNNDELKEIDLKNWLCC